MDIVRAFGVTAISVKRAVKLYREKGVAGFYASRVTRGAAVLLKPVIEEIEALLVAGLSEAQIAEQLGLKRDTLRKAIRTGRIRVPAKKKEAEPNALVPTTKSRRSEIDCAAPMGRGATATLERLAASLGQLDECKPRFEYALDVPQGGVLLALPALLASGSALNIPAASDQHHSRTTFVAAHAECASSGNRECRAGTR